MELRGHIPSVAIITKSAVHDVNILDEVIFQPGTICVMDRKYLEPFSFPQNSSGIDIFCNTGKNQLQPKTSLLAIRRQIHRCLIQSDRHSHRLLRKKRLPGKTSPHPVLRFKEQQNARVSAEQSYTAGRHDCRTVSVSLQEELFFKWIEQHLRIKSFFGINENGIKTQIEIVISVRVPGAIVKKTVNLDHGLYTILQLLIVTLFENTIILQVLAKSYYRHQEGRSSYQLNIFG